MMSGDDFSNSMGDLPRVAQKANQSTNPRWIEMRKFQSTRRRPDCQNPMIWFGLFMMRTTRGRCCSWVLVSQAKYACSLGRHKYRDVSDG